MSAHTAGPWSARDVGHGLEIHPDIAWVGYGTSHPKDEHRANANLIVAAPELLKLCKAFRIAAIFEGMEESSHAWRDMIAEAREIIAKATGGES